MKKKLLVFGLVSVIVLLMFSVGCDLEREAKLQAIGFAERFLGFDIHPHDHDLEVKETGLAVEEVYYVVTGTIKRKADLVHFELMANMQYIEHEKKWVLRELRIDGEYLYP